MQSVCRLLIARGSPSLLKKYGLKPFQKVTRVGAKFTSERVGMRLHRVSAIAEKAHLLVPFRWNSLANGSCNMSLLLDLMGWVDVISGPSDTLPVCHVGL